jgi:D-alanyl-lipoteichoic acid acyltransferase DltB (MBOAT superfamily)
VTFVSPQFVVFFLFVLALYFYLPYRLRLVFLCVVSLYFYAFWNIAYLPLLLISAGIDYLAAIQLERIPPDHLRQRRLVLAISMTTNLGILFTFKYFNFFADSLVALLTASGIPADPFVLNVLLPVGISFYTFQSMSYTIDVYRGDLKAERDPVRFLTFVAFFPQLVAGPIERATNLLPQFGKLHRFEYGRVVEGMRYILWGAFKKMVIADRLAIYVNAVYNDVGSYSGLPLIMATVFFAFQIYCDFSGYTDMAIGTAKILGFDLMENFRQPYLAKSLTEFWRRWHISLSTWFRDYVYIPLGGNRKGFGRTLVNLFIVFLVSGLWHGANWTFVLWGLVHGLGVVVEAVFSRVRKGRAAVLTAPVRWAITMVLVCAAWVFFRANSLEDAWYVFANLWVFTPEADMFAPFANGVLLPQAEFWLSIGLMGFLMLSDALDNAKAAHNRLLHTPQPFRWLTYYALGFGCLFALAYGSVGQDFIYFQF